jgi:hypothetical protein
MVEGPPEVYKTQKGMDIVNLRLTFGSDNFALNLYSWGPSEGEERRSVFARLCKFQKGMILEAKGLVVMGQQFKEKGAASVVKGDFPYQIFCNSNSSVRALHSRNEGEEKIKI